VKLFDQLLHQLKAHEGEVTNERGRHVVYPDSLGINTIGYGRNVDEKGLSDDEAEYLLKNDIAEAIYQVSEELSSTWEMLSQNRKAVVVDMVFNMGLPRFKGFKKMIEALHAQDYYEAAAQMIDSKWFGQVGRRGERLVQMMREG
jgi:lysozyme